MSYREHPTKNRELPPEYKGPRWWYISHYPEGKKRYKGPDGEWHGGVKNQLFRGTEAEASMFDLELRKIRKCASISVNPQFASSLPDFIDHYKLERAPRSVIAVVNRLHHLGAMFGKLPLNSITPALIEQYKQRRVKEGVKPVTINGELCALSALLKWAADLDLIEPPFKIKLFPGKLCVAPVPIMPPREEMESVVASMPRPIRGLAMLMFFAGLRREEATHLRAEDVLIDRGLIVIRGKGGKQRVVPIMHPPLIDELQRRIDAVKTGYLWLSPRTQKPYGSIVRSIKATAVRLGYSGRWYQHLLRHGFGTTAIESGIDLRSTQEMMGHGSNRTTELYTHIAATHLTEQMKKFAKPRQ